ncbi:hypothetical protein Pyrfu_1090 [Pyrolobus fumarii 1A]|uniref:MBL fold metallo-hydrolase n=1 Tax=Pyrolobus fumarii (strain DSM 11204 / 1A) TaxID=694429 RepID=G0EF61_PYRF1|nr:MBL fold metallo-hydrolase [Pyrolobus fumarii]AEM38958.1 hypothetical protein Pyrfu_1090 [Pyrolobus fumarii 1A]
MTEKLETLTINDVEIRWLGHAGFRIAWPGGTLYVDPYKVRVSPRDGRLVLVTHEHFDHCSPEDILRVASSGATLVAPRVAESCAAKTGLKVVSVAPGDKLELGDVVIETVPAYNTNKFRAPGVVFHPKEDGRVGYLIEVGGVRIFHAGDSDNIPEYEQLRGRVDVALLPVSGVYVMTAEEAAEAAKRIQPRVAIPMHYGEFVGSEADAEKLARLLEGSGVKVVILERTTRL